METTGSHLQKASIALGTTCEHLMEMASSVTRASRRVEDLKEIMEKLSEASTKAEQVVMFDNGPRYGPPPPCGRNRSRGRPRWPRNHLPTSERTDVSTGVSLSGVSANRLASRICDDAHRIVSADTVE